MALVVCPDCGKSISINSEICINCGFPIKKFLEENNFQYTDCVNICPVCCKVHNSLGSEYDSIYLYCDFCKSKLIYTDLKWKEYHNNKYKIFKEFSDDGVYNYNKELTLQYGSTCIDEEKFNQRIKELHEECENYLKADAQKQQTTQSNITRCPHCGGTAFTPVKRKFSILAGFATNKVDLVCNNCGRVVKPK